MRLLRLCVLLCLLSAPALAQEGEVKVIKIPPMHELVRRANAGDAESQYKYAVVLMTRAGANGKETARIVPLLTAAAEKGHPDAQMLVGKMYMKGEHGVQKDAQAAARWFEKAEAQGNKTARKVLAYLYMGDKEAFPRLNARQLGLVGKQLEEKDAETQMLGLALAQLYHMGERTPKDIKKAVALYERFGENADPYVWYHLGDLYAHGHGVQDKEKARKWLKKLVEKDIGIGYYDYAFLLYEIDPVKYHDEIIKWAEKSKIDKNARTEGLLLKLKGESKAVEQIKTAIARGDDAPAQKREQEFGMQVLLDLDFEKDSQKADSGDAAAQFRTGYAYFTGTGTARNGRKSITYFTKAAEQGMAEAQYQLGLMYEGGQAVYQNDKKAFEMYNAAAAQGFAPAQYRIAFMHAGGKGTRRNPQAAQQWLEKARAQGYAEAMEYDPAQLSLMRGARPEKKQKRSFDGTCTLLLKPEVTVELVFNPVTYNYTRTMDDLSLLATGMSSKNRMGKMTGLHSPTTQYKASYAFERAFNERGGGECLGVSFVNLKVIYDSVISIATEYPQGTCAFNNIKQHELRHRAVDEKLYHEYKPVLARYISELLYKLPPMGPMNAVMIDGKKTEMYGVVREELKKAFTALRDEQQRRQIYIDTPEEYNKGFHDCEKQQLFKK